MQYSIVKRSAVVGNFRIDAECYQEKYVSTKLKILALKNTTLGNEVSKYCKGIFDIKADSYSDSGIPFVRIGDLKDGIIDLSNIVYIPEYLHQRNYKTALRKGDIVLSKTAYPAASYVNISECNASQDTIAVRLKEKSQVYSEYLVVFLNTKFGLNQMKRWFTGNVQMHLNLSESREIVIPILTNDFQNKIRLVFSDAIELKEQSSAKIHQAQHLHLTELGLVDWHPQHSFSFVKKYSETQHANRIDADYFQPMYAEIEESIRSYPGGWDTLENLVDIQDSNFKPEEEIKYSYIELANIGINGEVIACTISEGKNLPSRARRRVETGDVIVSSIEGSLDRIALIGKQYNHALCSTGFHVLKSKTISPETLLVLMKSVIGQNQLRKGCAGTILSAISKNKLNCLYLPRIREEIQAQIQQKVMDCFNLRNRSKHMLECAKRSVEIAIEQDEQTATDWLEKNAGDG